MNPAAQAASALHRLPKPIGAAEFRDALLAICPPRFPAARHARPQRVGLAISGGVDSMALAFLFSCLIRSGEKLKIADHPLMGAYGVVVDHQLRPGSDVEASAVAKALSKMHLRVMVSRMRWKHERENGIDPATLPNLESAARNNRYHILGATCHQRHISSLFLAHHRDDQYETVLMRLLAGHGYRGLRGMQAANAIPECYDMSGVHKSGLLDDQVKRLPALSFKPTNREIRGLRRSLQDDVRVSGDFESITSRLVLNQTSRFAGFVTRTHNPNQPYLKPLNIEDGGVWIYRPLLEFDKNRLIATCEANGVPWFEDATNADKTLTTRNAVRHLLRNHTLPKALQKENILRLSKRADKRATQEEDEAKRLIQREGVLRSFDSNAGTLRIRLPTIDVGRKRRINSAQRDATLQKKQKVLAAVMIRKLIEFVTPDQGYIPLPNLDNVVRRLFPQLFLDNSSSESSRKAFSIAGVLFEPLPNNRWLLSRAPYPANRPMPSRRLLDRKSGNPTVPPLSELSPLADTRISKRASWKTCKHHQLWDNRFWIRLASTLPNARFRILPFHPSHSKRFSRALPDEERKRLEKVLRAYAPGKIRFSLPGLYAVNEKWLGGTRDEGKDVYPDEAKNVGTLLALPSLGIHLPGLQRWVRYDIRYRNVDLDLLVKRKRHTYLRHSAPSTARWQRRREARTTAAASDNTAIDIATLP